MKKLTAIFLIFLFLLFSSCVLIKQPLLSSARLPELSMLSELSLTNKVALKKHVKRLSKMNRTSVHGQQKVVNYIINALQQNGIDENEIQLQNYSIENREYKNIIVHFKQSTQDVHAYPKYIIGAHYDAYGELPGADDNASGIAGLLEISSLLNQIQDYNGRNIDLVFYCTEEPPFFGTEYMGSFQHAQSISDKTTIKLVMILEMIGYFSEEENSQAFPISLLKHMYPTKGNFIAIVSNFANSSMTRKVKGLFDAFLNENNLIDVQSINAPNFVSGIDFSDHRNYWQFDIPAVMITDTAFFRNKNYHTSDDTYEKLDYKKMKEVVDATIITVLTL